MPYTEANLSRLDTQDQYRLGLITRAEYLAALLGPWSRGTLFPIPPAKR